MNETWLTLTGNVGSVVVKDLTNGGQVATLRVATTPRRFANGEWSDAPTAWHTVKAWRALATQVAAQVHTGDPVVVLGRLVAEEWTRTDGTVASSNVVVASSLGLDLARGGARQHAADGPAPEAPPWADPTASETEAQVLLDDPWATPPVTPTGEEPAA